MIQTTNTSKALAWAIVAACATAMVCMVGGILAVSNSTKAASVIWNKKTYAPSRTLVSSYPSAMKDLATAAVAEISTFHAPQLLPKAHPRRATKLTSDPDVASYMYSNENGNWDGNFGPDNGFIPYETEPCTDGVCYENYPWYGTSMNAHGSISPLTGRKFANLPRKPTLLHQSASSVRTKHSAASGAASNWQDLLPAYKTRLQKLAWDVTDFPDIEDDAEIKDARQGIRDLYDPLEPLEEQGERSSAEEEDYADFYRAYSAYQLPHEVSNRGGPGPWVAENDKIGGGDLPPHAYPYSEAYYPPKTEKASLTINANGANSNNVFHVQGPNMINVNIGSGLHEDAEGGGYIYPDGNTPVHVDDPPSVRKHVSGRPILTGGTMGADEVAAKQGKPCDQDPECTFWQDAYNEAYF